MEVIPKELKEKMKERIIRGSVRLVFKIDDKDKLVEIDEFSRNLTEIGYDVYVDFLKKEIVAVKKFKKNK